MTTAFADHGSALDATEYPLRRALLEAAELHASHSGLDENWLAGYRSGVEHTLQMLRQLARNPDVRAHLNELERQAVPATPTDNLCVCGGLMWITPAANGDGRAACCDQCSRTEPWPEPEPVVVPLRAAAARRPRPSDLPRQRRS